MSWWQERCVICRRSRRSHTRWERHAAPAGDTRVGESERRHRFVAPRSPGREGQR